MMTTRQAGLAAAMLVALAGPARAADLDLTKPEDIVLAQRKMQCSATDGKPVRFWWHGNMYSRVPGEKDRLLFKVEGTNVRQCVTVKDDKRGVGYKMVSREVLFYIDPATNQVAKTWVNPWTQETVEVIQVANDPVNMRAPAFPLGEDGKPSPTVKFESDIMDGKVLNHAEVPLFYPNPLAGDYQPYIGGTYHATEMFDSVYDEKELKARDKDLTDSTVGWVRIAQWLPWMKMGDRTGEVYFNAIGKRVKGMEQLPQVLRAEIEANYPIWKDPPPLDDARPNETSWTYFKKKVPPAAAPEKKG